MEDEVIVWGGKEFRKSIWPKTFAIIKEYQDRREREERMKTFPERVENRDEEE